MTLSLTRTHGPRPTPGARALGPEPLSPPAPRPEPGPRLPRRRRRLAEKDRAGSRARRPAAGRDGEAGRRRSSRSRRRLHVPRGRSGARGQPRRGPAERGRRLPGSAAPGDDPRCGRGAGREGRWVSAGRHLPGPAPRLSPRPRGGRCRAATGEEGLRLWARRAAERGARSGAKLLGRVPSRAGNLRFGCQLAALAARSCSCSP